MKLPARSAPSASSRASDTHSLATLCRRIAAQRVPALSLAALGLAFAPQAQAATITVTTSDDVTSATNGNCTILEAVRAAVEKQVVDQCPAGEVGVVDTVVLPANATFSFSSSYGHFAALPDIDGPVIISGNADVFERASGSTVEMHALVVNNYNPGHGGGNLTISGVEIRNFEDHGSAAGMLVQGATLNAAGMNLHDLDGRGVMNDGGTLSLVNSVISRVADEGVLNQQGNTTLTGSGIDSSGSNGVRNYQGTLNLVDSTISGSGGAGIRNEHYSILQMNGGNVTDSHGWGVDNYFSVFGLTNATVSGGDDRGVVNRWGIGSLVQSTVTGNTGMGVVQSGNPTYGPTQLYALQSTVSDNGDTGIKSLYSDLILSESTVSGNVASTPDYYYITAGIEVRGGTAGLVNSTIAGNAASVVDGTDVFGTVGGALFRSYAEVAMVNSTVSGNVGPAGSDGYPVGGVYVAGYSVLATSNSIIDGNTSGGFADCATYAYGSIAGVYNNLSSDSSCGFTITASANLGGLANNGGPTQTKALLPGSPALDSASGITPDIDQRGVARPQNGTGDLGAYEYTSSAGPYTVTGGDTTPDAFSFAPVTNADLGVEVASNSIMVSGLSSPALATITPGASFTINGGPPVVGAWPLVTALVHDGDHIVVAQTSASSTHTKVSATLTIGGVSSTFDVTTALKRDTTPDGFSIAPVGDADPGAAVSSAPVVASGFNTGVTATVDNGSFSVNGGPAVTSATVHRNDSIVVTIDASSSFQGTASATLTIGSATGTFTVTTRAGSAIPTPFSFDPVTGATPGARVVSAPIVVSGLEVPASIGVSGDSSAQFCINDASSCYNNNLMTVSSGDLVYLRLTASSSFSTQVSGTLDIGGVTGGFDVTTAAQDTMPDPIIFASRSNVPPNSVSTTAPRTITGINSPVNVSVSGDSSAVLLIDGNPVPGGSATGINAGQTVALRMTAAQAANAVASATLTVGGYSTTWSLTTRLDDVPKAFTFHSLTDVVGNRVHTTAGQKLVGVNAPVTVSVDGDSSAVLLVDGAVVAGNSATVSSGQMIALQMTSSSTGGTKV
ncbi:MAG TPA: choice-of-anchor Q domain-containing protein, partial [Nevskiaceae bacterium]|nr:choice-of-anchor Q domain-containing protein [Nevskiaceae bacterium]